METSEFSNSLKVLEALLALNDEKVTIFDISIIGKFVDTLPDSTTLNKLIKDIVPTTDLILLLDTISDYYNSKTIYNNLANIFGKLNSNSYFDIYKETIPNGSL